MGVERFHHHLSDSEEKLLARLVGLPITELSCLHPDIKPRSVVASFFAFSISHDDIIWLEGDSADTPREFISAFLLSVGWGSAQPGVDYSEAELAGTSVVIATPHSSIALWDESMNPGRIVSVSIHQKEERGESEYVCFDAGIVLTYTDGLRVLIEGEPGPSGRVQFTKDETRVSTFQQENPLRRAFGA